MYAGRATPWKMHRAKISRALFFSSFFFISGIRVFLSPPPPAALSTRINERIFRRYGIRDPASGGCNVNISLFARIARRAARALYSVGNCAEFQPRRNAPSTIGEAGRARRGASRNARKSGLP